MIIRYAFFEGKIKEGHQEAFRKAIVEDLYPLWCQFPGALEVYCSLVDDRDEGAPEFPLIQSVRYPDIETMEGALASSVRDNAKAKTAEICGEHFEGRIHHHVCTPRVWAK